MIHARPDYNRIQDPAGLIPDDEPVFLIRAQDMTASETIEAWATINEEIGGDPTLIQMARDHAQRMREWQKQKVADISPQQRTAAVSQTETH